MHISTRTAGFRNLALSVVNGAITLIVLLIAPLGLAAVIINTLLITAATFVAGEIADRVIRYLQPSSPEEIFRNSQQIQSRDRRQIDRR
ncbi:MAG: CRISPR-associated protein Csx18 [Microcoleus sp.]|uniref:CRISPR-associated protein Csx18 n=1 Tax=Microcoleus sp. TaxID=44472 RepID=UPI003C74BA9D